MGIDILISYSPCQRCANAIAIRPINHETYEVWKMMNVEVRNVGNAKIYGVFMQRKAVSKKMSIKRHRMDVMGTSKTRKRGKCEYMSIYGLYNNFSSHAEEKKNRTRDYPLTAIMFGIKLLESVRREMTVRQHVTFSYCWYGALILGSSIFQPEIIPGYFWLCVFSSRSPFT